MLGGSAQKALELPSVRSENLRLRQVEVRKGRFPSYAFQVAGFAGNPRLGGPEVPTDRQSRTVN